MAVNKSVIVLVPNGRRQNVKVTPNTTILQVLEEVCQKHGYKPEDYDIKHYNQVLDATAIFRFTGLPNNAQLEMIACTKVRRESTVIIGIQLESGDRVTGDFFPTETLSQVLMKLCPEQSLATVVLVYMHQEVCGEVALKKTTLRSLGLCSGRAMLRLINRDPGQRKEQPICSDPTETRPSEKSTSKSDPKPQSSQGQFRIQAQKHTDPVLSVVAKDDNENKNKQPESQEENKDSTAPEHLDSNKDSIEPSSSYTEDSNVKFIGDRNALVFDQAGAVAVPRGELPDSFFDLTVNDAKALLRDVKRRREEFDEAPLQTSAQRNLDKNRRTLQQLHKYRKAVIRIQFPNQMVLQGLFGPLETIQSIKDFVKEHLADSAKEFVLYTTPPKTVLNPESRLIDENLVPSAILYYSGQAFLKPELQSKLTDPIVAGVQAVKSRMEMTREDPDNSSDMDVSPQLVEANVGLEKMKEEEPVPGPSSSTGSSNNSRKQRQNKGPVPKWFKQPFK